jgi:integrase
MTWYLRLAKAVLWGRRNLLRHIKAAAAQLGLSKAVDFRSFRTMHSSLMLREGARPEVVRDNMGHANIDVTQNVYGKSWWEERVDALTRAVEAVAAAAHKEMQETKQEEPDRNEWVPLWTRLGFALRFRLNTAECFRSLGATYAFDLL